MRQAKDRTLTIRAEGDVVEWLEGESRQRDVSVGAIVRGLVKEAMKIGRGQGTGARGAGGGAERKVKEQEGSQGPGEKGGRLPRCMIPKGGPAAKMRGVEPREDREELD